MAREPNCLPNRVRAVLRAIDAGDIGLLRRMIAETESCPERTLCEVAAACRQIHLAFHPLTLGSAGD